ncbi:hypothetical protein D3C87_1924630 [compost metagenome]
MPQLLNPVLHSIWIVRLSKEDQIGSLDQLLHIRWIYMKIMICLAPYRDDLRAELLGQCGIFREAGLYNAYRLRLQREQNKSHHLGRSITNGQPRFYKT